LNLLRKHHTLRVPSKDKKKQRKRKEHREGRGTSTRLSSEGRAKKEGLIFFFQYKYASREE